VQDYFLKERGIAYRTNSFIDGRKTILFVHGLSGSLSAWYPYEKIFENKHNLITLDLRGHGLSKKYARYEDYALQYFADDVSALVEHLNIRNCSLVAHSLGTTVALLFLLKNAPVVDSVVFLAPDYKVHTLLRTRLTHPLLAIGTSLMRLIPFSQKKGHRLDYSNFGYSPDWSLKRIVPEIRDMGVRLYCYCLQQIYESTEDYLWKKISLPVLILHGTHDSFVPFTHSVTLQKEMQHARLVAIEGANHMLVLNNVKEVADEIEKFMRE